MAALPHGAYAAIQTSGSCATIDPNGELAGVTGDFELTADPDDPQGRVLFVSNTMGGTVATQNVVVARLDGTTGTMIPGSLTTVATNFYGNSDINGPEWFRTPQGNLGIVYAGQGGVHLALRASPARTWNGFQYDYSGAPTNGSPPPLPNTIPGSYPNPPNQPPAAESYYSSYQGNCVGQCFANYQGGVATDVGRVLQAQGMKLQVMQPSPWDGYIYYSACKSGGGACGLYTAAIDGKGGLTAQTLVARTGLQPARQIAPYRHPVTGMTVVFTDGSTTDVAVWAHPMPNAQMALLANVPVPPGSGHYRAAASDTQVVLNFLIQRGQGTAIGSYTIAVSAAPNGALSPSPANRISGEASGSELDWYPAAGMWRIVYRRTQGYVGCWVTP
ncbi:MAG: hypothetical protein JSR21_16150 [Proteobacteria bacterium]|nr:hypothetical protein [Pseudomonadota bacterium]